MRRKSGLRRAQRTYQGRATTQNVAMAMGGARRRAARRCEVASAQTPIAPPARITAAGPLARTPRPRNAPKRARVPAESSWSAAKKALLPRSAPAWRMQVAAAAMARAIEALKSISGVAARAKPMAATLAEKIMGESKDGAIAEFVSLVWLEVEL